jgi:PAS domain-containing protein
MRQWELRGVTVDGPPGADVTLIPEGEVPAELVGPEREASLRTLVDQFPALFWTTDAELRVTSSLGAGLAALGLGPNQLVGTTLFEFFETADPRFTPIDAHKRALLGTTVAFDMEWAGRAFLSQVAPLKDSGGTTIGTICVALSDGHAGQSVLTPAS